MNNFNLDLINQVAKFLSPQDKLSFALTCKKHQRAINFENDYEDWKMKKALLALDPDSKVVIEGDVLNASWNNGYDLYSEDHDPNDSYNEFNILVRGVKFEKLSPSCLLFHKLTPCEAFDYLEAEYKSTFLTHGNKITVIVHVEIEGGNKKSSIERI